MADISITSPTSGVPVMNTNPFPPRPFNLAQFPLPVLKKISSCFANKRDVQCMRLVCKSFEKGSSPSLFKTAWYAPRYVAMANLMKVAKHPQFRFFVTDFAYDAGAYEESDMDTREDSESDSELESESESESDAEAPFDLLEESDRAAAYDLFLKDQDGNWWGKNGHKIVRKALKLFSNLSTIRLEGNEADECSPDRWREWSFTYKDKSEMEMNSLCLEARATAAARAVSRTYKVAPYWGLFDRLISVLNPDVRRRIRSLQCNLTHNQGKANGLPVREFDLFEHQSNRSIRLFSALQHVGFDLTRTPRFRPGIQAFAHLLGRARDLRSLRLSFHHPFPFEKDELGPILHRNHWPLLTSLSLDYFHTDLDDLYNFLEAHRSSLRQLTLCSVFLTEEEYLWERIADRLRDNFNLQGVRLVCLGSLYYELPEGVESHSLLDPYWRNEELEARILGGRPNSLPMVECTKEHCRLGWSFPPYLGK